MSITITPEYQQALDLILQGKNVFIHGGPGTGKSTFIEELVKRLHAQTAGKNVILLAPTGVAALRIGGQTLHSYFQLPFHDIYAEPERQVKRLLRRKFRAANLLIIDEISMVRADVFDRISQLMCELSDDEVAEPFAGKQVLLIGDLYQLPPVVKLPRHETDVQTLADMSPQDRLFLQNYPNGPYVFNTKCYPALHLHHVRFTQVFRQNDREFIDHLSALITDDRPRVRAAIAYFNKRCLPAPQQAVCLCARRNDTSHINQTELQKLTTPEIQIPAEYSKNPHHRRDWNEEDKCPAPRLLKLKVGARVMMLLNQPPLVNGSLGEVVGFNQGEDGTLESVRVRTQYGDQDIERHAWYQVTTNEQGRQEEDLSRYFRQFPLQLAWAVTIHKAQGMSFDTCCINLGERGAFCEGQAYVGLSRVRSIGGLFLKERLEEEDIMFDERVQQFYKTL